MRDSFAVFGETCLASDYVRRELDAVTSSGVSSTHVNRQHQLAMARVLKPQLPPSKPPLISSWQLRYPRIYGRWSDAVHRIGQRNDSPHELVPNREWPDTNSRSRCGSRLSDYVDGMAHGRVERDGSRIAGVKSWNKRHFEYHIADISIPGSTFL